MNSNGLVGLHNVAFESRESGIHPDSRIESSNSTGVSLGHSAGDSL